MGNWKTRSLKDSSPYPVLFKQVASKRKQDDQNPIDHTGTLTLEERDAQPIYISVSFDDLDQQLRGIDLQSIRNYIERKQKEQENPRDRSGK